jgi:hypothetical protein
MNYISYYLKYLCIIDENNNLIFFDQSTFDKIDNIITIDIDKQINSIYGYLDDMLILFEDHTFINFKSDIILNKMDDILDIKYDGSNAVFLKHDGKIDIFKCDDFGFKLIPDNLNNNFVKIFLGIHNCIGIKNDGTIICFGNNSFEKCGSFQNSEDIIDVKFCYRYIVILTVSCKVIFIGENNIFSGLLDSYNVIDIVLNPNHQNFYFLVESGEVFEYHKFNGFFKINNENKFLKIKMYKNLLLGITDIGNIKIITKIFNYFIEGLDFEINVNFENVFDIISIKNNFFVYIDYENNVFVFKNNEIFNLSIKIKKFIMFW